VFRRRLSPSAISVHSAVVIGMARKRREDFLAVDDPAASTGFASVPENATPPAAAAPPSENGCE
jgi:hypothetical protein